MLKNNTIKIIKSGMAILSAVFLYAVSPCGGAANMPTWNQTQSVRPYATHNGNFVNSYYRKPRMIK